MLSKEEKPGGRVPGFSREKHEMVKLSRIKTNRTHSKLNPVNRVFPAKVMQYSQHPIR
jgi:hypothetical protein